MDANDGPGSLQVRALHQNLGVGDALQQRRIHQVLPIRCRNDRDIFAIREAIQLREQGGEELIRVMPDGTAAGAAHGLDLVKERHDESILRRLPQALEERANVSLRLANEGRLPLRRFYHRDAAGHSVRAHHFACPGPREHRFSASRRPDHQDGLAALQTVARGAVGIRERERERGKHRVDVRIETADLIAPNVGHFFEQILVVARTIDFGERGKKPAVEAHDIARREFAVAQRGRGIDDQFLIAPLQDQLPVRQPALEERGLAAAPHSARRRGHDDVQSVRQKNLLADIQRGEVDAVVQADDPLRAAVQHDRARAFRRVHRAHEHRRVPRKRGEFGEQSGEFALRFLRLKKSVAHLRGLFQEKLRDAERLRRIGGANRFEEAELFIEIRCVFADIQDGGVEDFISGRTRHGLGLRCRFRWKVGRRFRTR